MKFNNRIVQFRTYNDFCEEQVAKAIGVSLEIYKKYESGELTPTIDIVEKLADCYKVTVNEFYGFVPRLTLHSNEVDDDDTLTPDVPEELLEMTKLSWDEKELIIFYRRYQHKESLMNDIEENRKAKLEE